MARKREQLPGRVVRMEARTRVINAANLIVFAMACLMAGSVAVALALPQGRKAAELEYQLELAKGKEDRVLAEKEYRDAELRALREDRGYVELRARDRLDLYREGEKVLRIRRQP
jgi:cell division protein FtsB